MISLDARRSTQKQRAAFEKVRRAERYYALQLRKIARHIEDIVKTFGTESPEAIRQMQAVLHRYADTIRPWARATSRRMLGEVMKRDERAWNTYSNLMGQEIRRELKTAPIADVYQQLMNDQVELITSLPIEAAKRVHELTTGAIYEGVRADDIAKEIMRSGEVSKARANLIARTEVGRASTMFTQVRAQHIGSEAYVWRTSKDRRVRPLHRKLEGKVIRWDEPPIAGEHGERAHAGSIYNCRCYTEPLLPSN